MRNIIFIIFLIAIAAGGGWYWYSWSLSGGEVKITGSSQESSAALELVKRIRAIEIDTSFFDDPDFLGLEATPDPSFGQFIEGRPNPFLSLTPPATKTPAKRR